jgi:hypothetical protein
MEYLSDYTPDCLMAAGITNFTACPITIFDGLIHENTTMPSRFAARIAADKSSIFIQ